MKALYNSFSYVFVALLITAIVALGTVAIAKAAIGTDPVTTGVNLPMLQVAMAGTDMTVGSYGQSVQTLETFLQNRGYFPQGVTPDFTFDLVTKQALIAYQYQAHLPATGYFGPYTRAHMWVVLWFRVNGVSTPFN